MEIRENLLTAFCLSFILTAVAFPCYNTDNGKGGLAMAISEAQRRAVAKYNAANYERVELRLKKGKKDTHPCRS